MFVWKLDLQSSLGDQHLENAPFTLAGNGVYDLVFVLTAIAFNLLIAGIFIAQKKKRLKLVRIFGIIWLILAIPLAIVFFHYLIEGLDDLWIMISFGIIFLYIFIELLLDYILKVDFRQKWTTHVPYIILEYMALFGLIWIAFAIGPIWGYLVSISFWILMVSLIYLYWGIKKKPGSVGLVSTPEKNHDV